MKLLQIIAFTVLLSGAAHAAMPPGSWYQPQDAESRAKGQTTLMYAASFGDVEQVRELLANGENPNQADKSGWTALHYACLGGESAGRPKEMSRLEVMKLLVKAGANVNALANENGEAKDTPLAMAASVGQVEWVRFLLGSGADPNIPGAMGANIPATADAGHSDKEAAQVITLLVDAGGDLNAKNYRGETAMQIAREEKRPAVIAALMRAAKHSPRKAKGEPAKP